LPIEGLLLLSTFPKSLDLTSFLFFVNRSFQKCNVQERFRQYLAFKLINTSCDIQMERDESIITFNMHSDTLTQRNKELKDCLLLFLMTAFIYLPFLGLPVWNGNEPLRVIIAKEMLKTGNWIIPMLHGNPYFTKPPMMNWLIAGSGSLFGVLNEWTSRIPSVCAVFATSLSVYILTKKWLSREARLFAAIAVISMMGLIKKGRSAEIDSLFIFFITIILLIWLNGYVRQWKPVMLWSISLSLVGVGFLAKGPQVIAFFYLTVFAYLLIRKRLRFFFSKSHLFGLLFFVFILGIYVSFVLQHVTIERYSQMWFN
jgi:4-amino-4-deoxy-L-arabinose transferase-like glycosyltransferase